MVDKYGLKFTRLQNRIFRLLCVRVGGVVNQRAVAKILGVSPTAVAKAIPLLKEEGLIRVESDSVMNLMSIELDRDSEVAVSMKRVENLKMLYESELVGFLES